MRGWRQAGVQAAFVRGRASRGGPSERGVFSSQVSGRVLENNLPAIERLTGTFLRVSGQPGKGEPFPGSPTDRLALQCPNPGCRFAAGKTCQGGHLCFLIPLTSPGLLEGSGWQSTWGSRALPEPGAASPPLAWATGQKAVFKKIR